MVGMVRCKRTKLYASLAYSRVFPGIYAEHSIEVKASKTRRRGLSSSFPLANEKSLFRKTNEVVTANPRVSLSAVCSDESKGERLESLGLPFERTVNLRMLYWNILRIYSKEYEDRLIRKRTNASS